MNPLIWIFVFIINSIGAWINFMNNKETGYFWWACLISILPIFPIISKYSKNLLIDGLLYDVIIFFAYLITLLLLGSGKNISLLQWIGFIITIIGCFIMKWKF